MLRFRPFEPLRQRSLRPLQSLFVLSALCVSACSTLDPQPPVEPAEPLPPREAPAGSAVARHGALAVKGNRIVNQADEGVSLAGNSFFWSNSGWEAHRFYRPAVVDYLGEDWGATIVRAAMGVEAAGGYLHRPQANRQRVETVVDAAVERGLYVIIDWHTHHAERYPEAAVDFFSTMARRYGEHPNVIYEIYNEPVDSDWSREVKPYSERVIAAIRATDPDNLIVVGSPRWSQDVDVAAADPITGYANIAYTLHFYAGTHQQELRDKARVALDRGLALVVTEWGTVNADGDGAVAEAETRAWMDFLREHGISHLNWAVNDKAEGASIFRPGTSPRGPWSTEDLTPSGRFVRELIRSWDTASPSSAGR